MQTSSTNVPHKDGISMKMHGGLIIVDNSLEWCMVEKWNGFVSFIVGYDRN